jgi:hypothetical protein
MGQTQQEKPRKTISSPYETSVSSRILTEMHYKSEKNQCQIKTNSYMSVENLKFNKEGLQAIRRSAGVVALPRF